MSEQRIQTVKIDWQTGDAKTKVVEFTRSIKGTDKAVEELNQTLGETATVTTKTSLSKKELTAQARKEFTAANRLVTKYNNLTDSLKHQAKMYNMTDESAEIYAAQMRLGANATKEQKDEVARLITVMQKQRTVSGKVQGSMRGLRGQAQNLGWQMQDVAVQMQMGTDAMVIFSQQGSQLASGFGPSGALIGALIAVGGAIAGVVLKTGEMKEMQKLTAVTTKKLTEELWEQAKAGEKLNWVMKQSALDIQDDRIKNTTKALEDQRKATQELLLTARKERDERTEKAKFAATTSEFFKAKDKKELEKTTKALNSALAKEAQLEKKLTEEKRNRRNIEEGRKFESKLDKGGKDAVSEVTRAFESEYNRLVKQTETLAEEYMRRRIVLDDYYKQVGSDTAKAQQSIRMLNEWHNTELKKIDDKRTDEAIKALQKETKRREKVLGDAEKEIGKGKTGDPVLDEMNKHNRLLKTLYAERNALGMSSYTDRQRINGLIEQETDRHGEALKDAQLTQMNTSIMQLTAAANMASTTVDLISDGGEKVKAQTAEMNAFQKGMFLTTQMLSAAMAQIQGINIGMNLAANASLTDFTGISSAAMVTLGTSLGAAQAGAIMGTTFAGMFDSGGVIPNGQAGVVAERYDEMVGGTMVYNNSGSGLNVTGSKDTASAMSGGSVNVTVVNNATGSVRAEVQQIDENNVKILIAEHFSKNIDKSVSGVIGKKGSKTDKAMRQNFNTTRKY